MFLPLWSFSNEVADPAFIHSESCPISEHVLCVLQEGKEFFSLVEFPGDFLQSESGVFLEREKQNIHAELWRSQQCWLQQQAEPVVTSEPSTWRFVRLQQHGGKRSSLFHSSAWRSSSVGLLTDVDVEWGV